MNCVGVSHFRTSICSSWNSELTSIIVIIAAAAADRNQALASEIRLCVCVSKILRIHNQNEQRTKHNYFRKIAD